MALGRRKVKRQADFGVPATDLPQSPGPPFYEPLNQVLAGAGFGRLGEESCQRFYPATLGRPSVPPGVYFRMRLVGYFEKLPSERPIAWRCADSLSLRAFLGLAPGAGSPDDSALNRSRLRIDLETHPAVFDGVLKRWAEHELLRGQRLGIDAATLEANAVRRGGFDRAAGDGAELPGVPGRPGQGLGDRDADGGGLGPPRRIRRRCTASAASWSSEASSTSWTTAECGGCIYGAGRTSPNAT
jgi:transposase